MAKRISAFGEVMMRLQVPGYESLVQAHTLNFTFSGTGVNIVSALSKFGHKGYLVSTLPSNPVGEAALAYLRKLGISTDYISRNGKYVGMYFLENGFGARPGRVTYTDRLASSFNTAAADNYNFKEIAGNMDMAHFCGITLAMNDAVRSQMKAFASEMKAAGRTVVFDCNYRPSLWGDNGYTAARPHYEDMLRMADIVMMNEKDAILILGMETEQTDRMAQLQHLIPLVAQQYGIRTIAGTHRVVNSDNTHSLLGYIYSEEQFEFSRLLTFSVYDRIGAGDAFASGIIHGEAQGLPAKHTVEFAARAAMLAHTVAGDTPTSTEAEILQTMTEIVLDVER
ncbi:sugar kinase [Paenibacillus tuaregi]|uniref:sugar kinase n=1 Tax=Paenibacillus tuaregi TaxID=1816681 RepID=UPI00083869A7|nr:sugar kinase [Paenibacillus tuaregi]